MESIFHSLLMLMLVVWGVSVVTRRIGLPTIMGELIMGVVIDPAVLGCGWVTPNEVIETLAHIGIEMGTLDKNVFSVVVFTAFLLNLATPFMLKGCAMLLERHPAHWSY